MNLRKRNSLAPKASNPDKENIVYKNIPKNAEMPQFTKTQSLHEVLECQKPNLKPSFKLFSKIHPEMQYSQEIVLNELKNSLHSQFDMQVEVENSEITTDVRSALISWLIDVHRNFKFRNETLHFCISLIDGFVERSNVKKCDYQLVGLTALFIAGKYEQIDTPIMRDFIAITDRLFEPYQILKMQGEILCTLNFRIVFPSVLLFINYFNKYISEKQKMIINQKYESLCYYLSEILLIDDNSMIIEPIYSALCIIGIINSINNQKIFSSHSAINILTKLTDIYQLNRKILQEHEKYVKKAIQNRHNAKFRSVNKKYEKDLTYFDQMLK